ncbi:MAG: hypothetical protein PVI06_09090, partial [Desulfobacterales bacterium]
NNGHRVLPFSAAIALCPLEAQERSACREKNTPIPQIFTTCQAIFILLFFGMLFQDLVKQA